MEIKRNKYLKMLQVRMHNGLIKVITGIRRCGKSYLLNEIFYNYLLSIGINKDQIIRFAFDSIDDLQILQIDYQELVNNKNKVNPNKFIKYISSKIKEDRKYYLLLDEVQFLDGFEYVLNGLLRNPNLDIYVTGSNSKFLSSDVLTEFRGRGDEIHVLPLSYSEFYPYYSGEKKYAFDTYLTYGGLPAICQMNNEEQKSTYLKTQMENVYLKDIKDRQNLKSEQNIDELLNVLASGISCLTNPQKLANTFKSVKKYKLSAPTIDKYINYLQEAFILNKVFRYDIKGKKYISTPYKIYFEDLGLRNARLDFRQVEETHLIENIIYNELRYRGFNVDVGVIEKRDTAIDKSWLEVDFVANKGSKRYYIQSAYYIVSEEKMNQEIQSFDQINDSFKKIIVVGKPIKPRYTEKGYLLINIEDFLLYENSLDF